MPLYEYQCNQCNKRHEIIQRFSEPPVTVCPECGGEMKKLISSPAIQFKGSGFYKTDYPNSRPSDAKSGSKAETTSEAKSDTKSETKSENKSDTKSESKSETKSETKSESKASE